MSESNPSGTLDPDSPTAPHAYQPRPRFVDQVVGMRGVIAVALACVVFGGVGGAVLGATTNGGNDGFGGRGGFPGGRPGGFQPGRQGQFQRGQVPPQGQAPNGG